MTIAIVNDLVQITTPGESRSMTLEQYARHKRDGGAFDALMKAGATNPEKTALDAAVAKIIDTADAK